MQDELTRAEHYRELALQMRSVARQESDHKRRGELLNLAGKYEALAGKLVANHANQRF